MTQFTPNKTRIAFIFINGVFLIRIRGPLLGSEVAYCVLCVWMRSEMKTLLASFFFLCVSGMITFVVFGWNISVLVGNVACGLLFVCIKAHIMPYFDTVSTIFSVPRTCWWYLYFVHQYASLQQSFYYMTALISMGNSVLYLQILCVRYV